MTVGPARIPFDTDGYGEHVRRDQCFVCRIAADPDGEHVVYRDAHAVATVVPTERIYVASLGSNQANAHVHWHITALPPGVPLEDQQFQAMMPEARGVLDLSEAARTELAAELRAAINR